MNKELPKHIEEKLNDYGKPIYSKEDFPVFLHGAEMYHSLLSASTEQGTVEERAKEYANKEADQNDYTVAVTEALELAYINGYNSASTPNPAVQQLIEKWENEVKKWKGWVITDSDQAEYNTLQRCLTDLKSLQSQIK